MQSNAVTGLLKVQVNWIKLNLFPTGQNPRLLHTISNSWVVSFG